MISIPRKTYDECEKQRVLIPEGQYLVEILDVEGNDASEFLNVKYRTLMPNPGMEGEERFFLSEKAFKRFSILAKRAGLQDRGGSPEEAVAVDPYEMVGMQFVVKIGHEELTDKKGNPYTVSKWGYADFWAPDHADVAGFMRTLGQRSQPGRGQTQQYPQGATNGRQVAAAVPVDDEV